jgi:hypothetical protein
MAELLIVEMGGVRVVWDKSFIQSGWYATFSVKPDISKVEFVLFNREDRAYWLAGLANTGSEPNVILYSLSSSPDPKKCIEENITDFLSVRRILKSPTQTEAVDLLMHENDSIREYARERWAEWSKQWLAAVEQDRPKVYNAMVKKARKKPPTQ